MGPGAVTALVDGLEGRGHVGRMPNPEDRRSMLLRETESGLVESLGHPWTYIEEMRGMEEGFTEEERAVISRFLKAAHRDHPPARGEIILKTRCPKPLDQALSMRYRTALPALGDG